MRRPAPVSLAITALALGAATTVALAWLAMPLPRGNAWHGPRTTRSLGMWAADDGKLWEMWRGDNGWHTVICYSHMQISGMSVSIPAEDYEQRKLDFRTLPPHLRPGSVSDLYIQAWYHRTGWPLPALACSVHWKKQIANSDIIYRVRGGLQLPRDRRFNPRAFPLTPVWTGFAIDTLLFGIAWLGVLALATAGRRRRRMKRGCCPRCGYNRSGLNPGGACPECGADIPGARGTLNVPAATGSWPEGKRNSR